MMESMVTEPESIKREIDISNDIREVEENVYGSPFLALGKKLAWSVNEELIAGASSDNNVDRIRTSHRAVLKLRKPECQKAEILKTRLTKIKAGSLVRRKHKRKRKHKGTGYV